MRSALRSETLRASLSLLQGTEMTEDAALRLMEAIDITHSGDIDEVEFVVRLRHLALREEVPS